MAMVDALLPEFDREMTITRRLLERVPEDKFAWKPHMKSMSLVELATHVATLPGWGAVTLKESEIDFACGFHANLSSGTRSRSVRVVVISRSNSGRSASAIAMLSSFRARS